MVAPITLVLIFYIFQGFLNRQSSAGIFGFGGNNGKIKSLGGMKRGSVAMEMTDGQSLRLRLYRSRAAAGLSCEDTVVLEYGPHVKDQPGQELQPLTISCPDLNKIHKTVSTGFLSLGNSIYFKVEDNEVKTLFMIGSKCIYKIYTDKNGKMLNKVKAEELRGGECKTLRNNWQPKRDQFEYDARLMVTPKASSTTDSSKITETPSQEAEVPGGTKKADVATQTEILVTDEFPSPPEESPESWPEVEDGFMKLRSQDGGIPDGYNTLPDEHLKVYMAGHLNLVMQNYYGPMQRSDAELPCVRRLSLFYHQLSLGEVTVSCGPVQGLTMTPVFIKYRRAFVLDASLPFVITAMFNPQEGPALDTCVQRIYRFEGTNYPNGFKLKKEEERVHRDSSELCQQLMGGAVRGRILHSLYDDSHHGLLENVFVSTVPAAEFDKSTPEIEIKDQATVGAIDGPPTTDKVDEKAAPNKSGLLGWGRFGL